MKQVCSCRGCPFPKRLNEDYCDACGPWCTTADHPRQTTKETK